jgi:glutathione reductase (NADPH)
MLIEHSAGLHSGSKPTLNGKDERFCSKENRLKSYDIVIVGSGTAGQTVAHELAKKRIKLAVVEQSDRPGGTCALRGCQAKKWFYEGAETIARARHLSGIGIQTAAVASWSQLRDAKNKFTGQVPERTIDAFEKAGVDFIQGTAKFLDERTLAVDHTQLAASFFVLASGSFPMPLPMEGAHLAIDSTEFMELPELPGRIIFIGGGFISFEFAHFANRLGPENIRCTILEAGSHPLGPFDEEMVDLLVKASADEGIDIHCDVEIVSIEKFAEKYRISLKDGRRFEADIVVHGAGRAPDISELELDRAGIDHGKRGVRVDVNMMTSNPNVFAVGDCAATIQLARVADYEAKVAAANILQIIDGRSPSAAADYSAVPSLLFTYPQYGMVGATERKLKKEGVVFKKSFAKNLSWPTYRRIGMRHAAYKLLKGNDDQLLGAHVLSDNAAGLVNTFALAMTHRIPVDRLYRQSILTPYPTRESDLIYMLQALVE